MSKTSLRKLREKAIETLQIEGADITEENISAVMAELEVTDNAVDYDMADQIVKSMKSLRQKADVPVSIKQHAVLFSSTMKALVSQLVQAIIDSKPTINVEPTPITIESPSLPAPIAERAGKKRFMFVINRDMNGYMESVEVIEEPLEE